MIQLKNYHTLLLYSTVLQNIIIYLPGLFNGFAIFPFFLIKYKFSYDKQQMFIRIT